MKIRAAAVLLAVATAGGCRLLGRPTCEHVECCTIAVPEVEACYRIVESPAAEGARVIEGDRVMETRAFETVEPAAHFTASIQADEIKIQVIENVNGVLLSEAISAALGRSGYVVDGEGKVSGNQVIVRTKPKRSGDTVVFHVVVAKINLQSNDLTFTVYSTGYAGPEGAAPSPMTLPEEVPQKVFENLREHLAEVQPQ